MVICCDGNPHSVVRSSHQQLQRSTFDSFHKGNTVKEIVVTDLDGDVVLYYHYLQVSVQYVGMEIH